MRVLDRVAVVVFLLAVGCGSGGTNKPPVTATDAAADDDAGPSGRRGGGGPFGGGDEDGGVAYDLLSLGDVEFLGGDAPSATGEDAGAAVDATVPRDRNRDQAPAPDAPTSSADSAPDLAAPVDTAPLTMCQMCQVIEQQYSDAVAAATTCTVGLKGQCSQKISSKLSCPCTDTWVNSTAEPDKIAKQWQDMGCAKCQRFCPLACRVLNNGVCSASKMAVPAPGPDPGPILGRGTCTDQGGLGP